MQVNRASASALPIDCGAEAGLPETGVVYCSFNQTYKITPCVFDIWMRILARTPGSVLWILASNRWAADNLRQEARARGIDDDRLVFAPPRPQADHLGRLTLADIFLDTLEVNAHTTASDALWAGVPVLTCPGDTFASRVAGSLLHAMELPELVMPTLADYEQEAIALGQQPEKLAALKAKVHAKRRTAALFDIEKFTRHLEASYKMMWARYVRGEAPAAISVPRI